MSDFYPRQKPNIKPRVVCPQCGQEAGKRLQYTWWGGAIGPALLHLTKCWACGFQFNEKTGKSTKIAIVIYNVIAIGIAVSAVVAEALLKR